MNIDFSDVSQSIRISINIGIGVSFVRISSGCQFLVVIEVVAIAIGSQWICIILVNLIPITQAIAVCVS